MPRISADAYDAGSMRPCCFILLLTGCAAAQVQPSGGTIAFARGYVLSFAAFVPTHAHCARRIYDAISATIPCLSMTLITARYNRRSVLSRRRVVARRQPTRFLAIVAVTGRFKPGATSTRSRVPRSEMVGVARGSASHSVSRHGTARSFYARGAAGDECEPAPWAPGFSRNATVISCCASPGSPKAGA